MALARNFILGCTMFTHVIPRTPSFGVYYVIEYYSGSTSSDHPGQAGAGAGARRTYGAAQARGRSLGKGGHRKRVFKSLGSRARALRKYACDAIAKRQTVHHVSVDCK
eukprot:1199089-Pleurochrysis_carterae.AAC.1